MSEWIDMLEQQPEQGQRILAFYSPLLRGNPILNYDRFSWEQWSILKWKPTGNINGDRQYAGAPRVRRRVEGIN